MEIQHNVAVVRKKLGQYDIAASLLRQVLAKTETGNKKISFVFFLKCYFRVRNFICFVVKLQRSEQIMLVAA